MLTVFVDDACSVVTYGDIPALLVGDDTFTWTTDEQQLIARQNK